MNAREVMDALADAIVKDARSGCCADRRKPCEYHDGYGDGLDRFCRAVFSSELAP